MSVWTQFAEELHSEQCFCGKPKSSGRPFCLDDWNALDDHSRAAIQERAAKLRAWTEHAKSYLAKKSEHERATGMHGVPGR